MTRLAEVVNEGATVKGTVGFYINKYIDSRKDVISPSSLVKYNQHRNQLSSEFKNIPLAHLKPVDVQKEMNRFSKGHAPKTVKCLHGFVASVVGYFRPQLKLKTTLPQNIETERHMPSEEEIKAILEAAKGTEDSIAFQLGILGLRESEITALELSDLKGNELHIHANMVRGVNGWEKKESPKTDAGNRTIYLPDALVKEINDKGYFFKYTAPKLCPHLHKVQRELGIPECRFHDLRHFFASYAATMMPESDAMALGGWKSDYVFKKVYRESLKKQRQESAMRFNEGIFKAN